MRRYWTSTALMNWPVLNRNIYILYTISTNLQLMRVEFLRDVGVQWHRSERWRIARGRRPCAGARRMASIQRNRNTHESGCEYVHLTFVIAIKRIWFQKMSLPPIISYNIPLWVYFIIYKIVRKITNKKKTLLYTEVNILWILIFYLPITLPRVRIH